MDEGAVRDRDVSGAAISPPPRWSEVLGESHTRVYMDDGTGCPGAIRLEFHARSAPMDSGTARSLAAALLAHADFYDDHGGKQAQKVCAHPHRYWKKTFRCHEKARGWTGVCVRCGHHADTATFGLEAFDHVSA